MTVTSHRGRSLQYEARITRRQEALSTALSVILPGKVHFTWEVGCGHGHFLTAYAHAYPEKLCIGIDIMGERITRAERKRNRSGLQNLFFIQAEARLFLDSLPAGSQISETFILFPDPWPKVRHHKHRIISRDFLRDVARKSPVASSVYFRTDYTPYFEAASKTLSESPYWNVSPEAWPFEYKTVFQDRASIYHSLVAIRTPTTTPQA